MAAYLVPAISLWVFAIKKAIPFIIKLNKKFNTGLLSLTKLKKVNKILYRLNCIFLLCVFAFANTPKRILHDVVTSHKHSTHQEKSCTHKHTEVTTSGYHCDTENLVVNGIYTIVFEPTFIFAKPDFFIAFSASAYYTQTLHQQYFLLRGPPVC